VDESPVINSDAWVRWDITALVQDWVAGMANYGMIVIDKNSDFDTAAAFHASEYSADKLKRPKLVVHYDEESTTIVRQKGTTPLGWSWDTYLSEANPTRNFGASSEILLNSGVKTKNHPIVRFRDVTGKAPNSILPGIDVSKAELVLYCSSTGGGLEADASFAYGIRQAWDPGVQDNTDGAAGWKFRNKSVWSIPGAAGFPAVDHNTVSTGNKALSAAIGQPVTWRCDTAAQHWADGQTNWGIALLPGDKVPVSARFFSSEGSVSDFYNPKLIATFSGTPNARYHAAWAVPDMPLHKLYTRVKGSRYTLSFRQGDPFGNTEDCTIERGGSNLDTSGSFHICLTDTSDASFAKKALIRFTDFIGPNSGQVPPGSIIDTAYIRLVEQENTFACTLNVYSVNQAWSETQARWDSYRTDAGWANPAAGMPVSATLIYEGVHAGGPGWWDTLIVPVTQMVRTWVKGRPNNGIMLEAAGSDADNDNAFDSEDPTSECRPQLVVAYRRPEQVVVQNMGREATEAAAFSSEYSLRNQFYLSFHLSADSTDGMMDQFRTAATSPGKRVRDSYNLLPHDMKHFNLFNILRRTGNNPWSSYANSVHSDSAITMTVIESTTTRMRYRIHPRRIFEGGNDNHRTYPATEITVYPTGHLFIWDSARAAGSSDVYNYRVDFSTKDGTGTPADNDTSWGGLYNTASGQNSLHDWVAGFLSYKSDDGTYPADHPGKPFPFGLAGGIDPLQSDNDYKGISFYRDNDDYWNSKTGPYQQTFMIDFSTDNADHADSLRKRFEDKGFPANIQDFRAGLPRIDAPGDLNSDGFNEREGCYELNAIGNSVYFWFNEGSTRTRYYPVFKVNNYTTSAAPTRILVFSQDQLVTDTCYPDKGDVNISLFDAENYLVFQLNRIIDGPVIILCETNDKNVSVEMSGFWGNSDSGACSLFWTTESEHENLGFRLLRKLSPSDAGFKVIAHYARNKALKGRLTRAARSDYAYTDHDVKLGKTYKYTLETVDVSNTTARHGRTVTLTVDKTFAFDLAQNFPNPFNPVTAIRYTVPGRYSRGKKQFVKLRVYDTRGRLVRILLDGLSRPGQYTVNWNGKTNSHRYAASGLYLYRIQVGDKWMKARKMVIVK
jgi:hypothetical protein